MTQAELRNAVLQSLAGVAPELDPASIQTDVPLRDQVDLDSMDFLRFIIDLNRRVGVDIPEADYPKVSSLSGAVHYLAARLGI